MFFSFHFSFLILADEVTKIQKYYVICLFTFFKSLAHLALQMETLFTFLLSKARQARQAKTEHMEMKILQPIFGIMVVLTKNELTKIPM